MIFLCGVGYCYFKTDLFKTPDVLFKKYLSKNVTQIMNSNYEPWGSAIEKMSKEAFEDDLKIEVDMKKLYGDEDLELLDEEELEGLENNYLIDFKVKSDIQKQQAELNAEFQMGEYASKLNTLVTTEEMALQLDELNEKYFVIQNKELKKLFEKFGLSDDELDELPDKIITDINYDEQIEKIKSLEEKYTNKIFDLIPEEKYSIEKKVNIEYNGENYTANKYALTLTDKEVANIFLTVFKELIDDQEFLSLISEEEKEEFEKQISQVKEELSDVEKKIEKLDGSNVEFSIYDVSDSFAKIEVKYKEDSIVIHSNNAEGNNNLKIELSSSNESLATITIDNQFANNEGNFTISVLEDSEENKIMLKSTYDGNTIKTSISFDGEEFEEINKALTITNTIKFNDVKITSLDEENSIILNDLSEDEIEKLVSDIQENIAKSAEPESNSLIGMMLQSTLLGSMTDNNYDYEEYNNMFENEDNNITIQDEDADIEEERQKIEDEVEDAISKLLNEYHMEKITNDDADPAEYLTADKIESLCRYAEASIVDGNTIKSVKGDNVYYTKIYINGEDWTLTSVETTYSESGEIE